MAATYNPQSVREQVPLARAANTGTSSANAAVAITYAAVADRSHAIMGCIAWSYSATPTGSLTVTADGVTVFSMTILTAGHGFIPFRLAAGVNEDLVVTLGAGGGTTVGKINVVGHVSQFGEAQGADA